MQINDLTNKEKEGLEDTVCKCQEKLTNAKGRKNQQQIAEAQKEWDRCKEHLLNEYGLKPIVSSKGITFAQRKRPGPEAEKVRKTVTNQIKNALKDIDKANRSLGTHVRNHITTGLYCIYRSDDSRPINWYISW